jgi:limonene-1,2-epoxide hydrolase
MGAAPALRQCGRRSINGQEATMNARIPLLIIALSLPSSPASAQVPPPCSPSAVVRSFLASFSTLDAAVVTSFLDDNVIYTNTGLPTILGRQATYGFVAQFLPLFSYAQFEEQSLMSQGHEVLMRRVEHYTISLQAPIGYVGVSFDLPVMGRYVVNNCLITEWGDYWNTAQFTSLSGIPM